MKNLTIIGGSGFIGKSYIDAFNKGLFKKYKLKKINIVCRNPIKLKKNRFLKLNKINLIKADISKLKELPNSNYFIYAVEPSDIKKYANKKIIKQYSKAITNFCNLLKKNKKSKTLYVSSGSIYGKSSNYKINYKDYSDLKKFSENEILKISKLGFKVSIARCFSFIGPWLPLNQHYAIGNFIRDGFHKKFIHINANKKVYRSYMYSDDLVIWLTKILLNSNNSCPIYNVGSDKKIEIKKLAKIIAKIFNKQIKVKKIVMKNKIDKYIPNISKTRKELSLKLTYNLKKSILFTINQINEQIN